MAERVGQYPYTEFYGASDVVLQTKVVDDDFPRLVVQADGTILVGDGTAAPTAQSGSGGVILYSPNETAYRLVAANDGTLSTEAV